MAHCAVLPGLYGILVQGLLFLFSVAVLGVKFWRDHSGRTLRQFVLDSSKQVAGSGWTHCLNLLCALVLGQLTAEGDQCAVYWIEIMIDTTLGVAVEFYLLQLLILTVGRTCGAAAAAGLASGAYFDGEGRFLLGGYAVQLSAWLLVVTGMKISMVLLMVLGAPLLQPAAALALAPVLDQPHLKLLVVMILTPGIMNAVQFWLVDNIFVHAKEHPADQSELEQSNVDESDDEEQGERSPAWDHRSEGGAAAAVLLLSRPVVKTPP